MGNVLARRGRYAVNPISGDDSIAIERERAGKEVIRLNQGDPPSYFPTPKYIIDAFVEALRAGKTSYSDPTGIKELKQAIIGRYSGLYKMGLEDNDIIVTTGVSEALKFINDSLINTGDNAILFRPYYAVYLPYLKLAGGVPLFENYAEADGWNIEIEHVNRSISALKRSGRLNRVKYLLLTNPNNPTGTVLRRQILEEIVEIANENDIMVVSDEIYDEIVYGGAKFTSIGEIAQGVPHMVLNGASKNFDATGFRLGFAAVPEKDPLSKEVKKRLADFAKVRLSVNTPAQYAFAAAMNDRAEHRRAIRSMVKGIEERVNWAVKRLKENEYVDVVKPNGAFYVFPRLHMDRLRVKDDADFEARLLRETGVWVVKGSGFGAPGHFRIVALPPKKTLDYALGKINDFCTRIAK